MQAFLCDSCGVVARKVGKIIVIEETYDLCMPCAEDLRGRFEERIEIEMDKIANTKPKKE